jgi:hypothetical protein
MIRGVKRLLGSVGIGCSLALLPLLMFRVFPGVLPRPLVGLLFMPYVPGMWISILTAGRAGNVMSFTLFVVISCAIYSAAVYAIASLRSGLRNADSSSS